MKRKDYEKTSEALYISFVQFRDDRVPISGPILKEKALQSKKEFPGKADFPQVPVGRWKKRYGIRQLSICGEKFSSDFNEMASVKKKFKSIIEVKGLTLDHMYYCDETYLNYEKLLTKSLTAKTE